MTAPPIPPLPPGALIPSSNLAPPLPPIPPQLQEGSPPRFDNPLVAPRPHRLDPDLPANVSRGIYIKNLPKFTFFFRILDGSHTR